MDVAPALWFHLGNAGAQFSVPDMDPIAVNVIKNNRQKKRS